MVFTHRGWFGLCPVFVGMVESEGPALMARHPVLEWWLDLQEILLGSAGFVLSLLNPGYEPMWPIRIGAPLDKPIEAPSP